MKPTIRILITFTLLDQAFVDTDIKTIGMCMRYATDEKHSRRTESIRQAVLINQTKKLNRNMEQGARLIDKYGRPSGSHPLSLLYNAKATTAAANSPIPADIPIAEEESSTGSEVGAPVIGSGVGALDGAAVGGFVKESSTGSAVGAPVIGSGVGALVVVGANVGGFVMK
jgi:hypothetical protein